MIFNAKGNNGLKAIQKQMQGFLLQKIVNSFRCERWTAGKFQLAKGLNFFKKIKTFVSIVYLLNVLFLRQ